jgi:arginyl-tRNA synthetase
MADSAIRSLEISHVAKFAFGLAQAFNAFYHRQPIMREERADVRLWRAAAVASCRQQLTLSLDAMGIRVPHRM